MKVFETVEYKGCYLDIYEEEDSSFTGYCTSNRFHTRNTKKDAVIAEFKEFVDEEERKKKIDKYRFIFRKGEKIYEFEQDLKEVHPCYLIGVPPHQMEIDGEMYYLKQRSKEEYWAEYVWKAE